jgi:predicted flap endonuclease-1-like 5' DNA nuclease
VLRTIDNLTKEKQKEKDRKKQQEKERQSKEREELKKRFEDSSLEIQDVPGVGPTTARKFKETGIISVVDLGTSNAEDLVDAMYFHLSSKERKELVEHIAKHIAAAKKLIEEKEKKED